MRKTVLSICLGLILLLVSPCFRSEARAAVQYDRDAAIRFAQAHVYMDLSWQCAEFVSNCIDEGGIDAYSPSGSALRAQLVDSGLCAEYIMPVDGYGYAYEWDAPGPILPGDVVFYHCTYHHGGRPFVHTALFSGWDEEQRMKVYARHNSVYDRAIPYRCGYSNEHRGGGYIDSIYVYHFLTEDEPSRTNYSVNFDKSSYSGYVGDFLYVNLNYENGDAAVVVGFEQSGDYFDFPDDAMTNNGNNVSLKILAKNPGNANLVVQMTQNSNVVYSQSVPLKAMRRSFVRPQNGYYIIQSGLNSNKAVDVSNGRAKAGTNIQLYSKNNTASQKFKIERVSGEWYVIRSALNENLVLDVQSGGKTSGTNVWLYNYNGTDSQKWRFVSAGNGKYYIQSALGYYLDVSGGKTANGTNIWVYDQNKTDSQKFSFRSAR